MNESTKIDFRYRRVSQLDDITDLVAILCPGNKNQQHAAARILLALRVAKQPIPTLADLECRFDISRRTLQRARAKLSRLGLIEHVTWMNLLARTKSSDPAGCCGAPSPQTSFHLCSSGAPPAVEKPRWL